MVQCLEAPVEAQAIATGINDATDDVNSRFDLSQLDLEQLNADFESASPQDILAWCLEHIPQGLAQSTSFSMLAITHMLYRELGARVPVIFLDTLHLFPETLATAQQAQREYDLDLHTYQVQGIDSREAFADQYGDALWATDIEQFHTVTKVEPLQRALSDLQVKAWITGRRRDQSESRQNMPIFEQMADGKLKINPLANWTRKDIWTYTMAHNVLYNPLHDQGYTSIGDEPLTTPVIAGEDERAGRWRGSVKTECGIHV